MKDRRQEMKTVRARIEELERKTTPAPAKPKFETRWPDGTDRTPEPGDVVLKWPDDPAPAPDGRPRWED